MSYFRELSSYRETILNQLISNPRIVQAVGNNNSDFLTNPDNSIIPESLLYSNIYPYRYLNEPNDKEKTYITFYIFGANKSMSFDNDAFKNTYIGFDIYSHAKLLRTDEGFLRFDFIVAEIDEMIHDRKLGESITKAQLMNHTDFSINDGLWHGAQLSYSIIDKKLSCKY